MSTTVVQIMDGLETRLATISGLRTSEYKPDQVTPPQAIVGVPPIDFHRTMGNGSVELICTVTVLVSKEYTRAAQRQLAAFASWTGTSSIFAALEGDKTLGGVVSDLAVMHFQPIGLDTFDTLGYFGGVFSVTVEVPGI